MPDVSLPPPPAPASPVRALADLAALQEGAVVSRILLKNAAGSATVFRIEDLLLFRAMLASEIEVSRKTTATARTVSTSLGSSAATWPAERA